MQPAIELLQHAVALDPQFVRAYAALANAYGPMGEFRRAEETARRALDLDPNNAEAHIALAGLAGLEGRVEEMASHDRAALASAGDDGFVRMIAAVHRASMGQLQVALADARSAYTLAPAHAQVVAGLAAILSISGQDAEALRYARLAVTLGQPEDDFGLTYVFWREDIRAGRYATALNKLIDSSNVYFKNRDSLRVRVNDTLRLIHAALEDPSQRAVALAARARWSKGFANYDFTEVFSCGLVVRGYVLLGALDTAYDLDNRCPGALIPWSPEMRPFRQDPRFQALATRLGLMAYWQQHGPPDECELLDGKLTCH